MVTARSAVGKASPYSKVDLVLADGDFVVTGFDLNAHLVESDRHVLAHIGGDIG